MVFKTFLSFSLMITSATIRAESTNDSNFYTLTEVTYPERARFKDYDPRPFKPTPQIAPDQINILRTQVPRPPIQQHRKW